MSQERPDVLWEEFYARIDDEPQWLAGAAALAENSANFSLAEKLKFLRGLDYFKISDANREKVKTFKKAVFQNVDLVAFEPNDIFALFFYCSQTKNYDDNKELFEKLAEQLAQNISSLSEPQKKFFYAQLEKHDDVQIPALTDDDELNIAHAFLDKKESGVWTHPSELYTVIKTMADARGQSRFYVITKKLGAGAFGDVYMAKAYYPKTGQLGKKVAVKIFVLNNAEQPITLEEIKKEAGHLQKTFETEMPIQEGEKAYVVTEYISGKDLGKWAKDTGLELQLHDSIKDLPFNERVELLYQLVLDLNAIHHEKKSGVAYIHRDLKPQNIRVSAKDNKVKDVRIVDYGFFTQIDDNPSALITDVGHSGTPAFRSPELLLKNLIGLKSDIRALVPTMLLILGVTHPFDFAGTSAAYRQHELREFDITALSNMDFIPAIIKPLLIGFLNKMALGEDQYDKRPDSDEVVRFFTLLKQWAHPTIEEERKSEILETLEYFVMPEEMLKKDQLPKQPQNQFVLFLHATQTLNASIEKRIKLVDVMLKNIRDFSPAEKLKIFSWLSDSVNYKGNERRWLFLAAHITQDIDNRRYSKEEKLKLLSDVNQRHDQKNAAMYSAVQYSLIKKLLPEIKAPDVKLAHVQDKLAVFVFLSKRRHHEMHKEKWSALAGEIIADIRANPDSLTVKQKLTFMRMQNKYKAKHELNVIVSAVYLEVHKNAGLFSAKKVAERKLLKGINGSSFFAKRYLKQAINAKDKGAMATLVNNLTITTLAA